MKGPRAFGSYVAGWFLGLVLQWRLQETDGAASVTFSLSFRFILELKESSACERQKSMDALENNVGSTFS